MKGKAVVHKKSTVTSDERETPNDLFSYWDSIFHFNLDAAATDKNAKCKEYFTKKSNALTASWFGRVWCNPPYSRVGEFVKKASEESKRCELIVMLLPARTGTKWFHEYIWKGRQTPEVTLANRMLPEVRFLQGRICFEVNGKPIRFKNKQGKLVKAGAPFDSMLIIWRNKNEKR